MIDPNYKNADREEKRTLVIAWKGVLHAIEIFEMPDLIPFNGRLIPEKKGLIKILFQLPADNELEGEIAQCIIKDERHTTQLSRLVKDPTKKGAATFASNWTLEGFRFVKMKLLDSAMSGKVELLASCVFDAVTIR